MVFVPAQKFVYSYIHLIILKDENTAEIGSSRFLLPC